MPADRAERLRLAMMGNGGTAASALVGLQASRVRAPASFRYCPECFRDDYGTGREFYWRRLHQLTGIEACPEHGVFLEDSSVLRLDRVTRHRFEIPPLELCKTSSRTIKQDNQLSGMARLGEALLAKKQIGSNQETLHENIIRLLCRGGFTKQNGTVKTANLIKSMSLFYSESYLEKLGGEGWVERLIRRPRGLQAPIRYLALLNFLEANLDDLFRQPVLATCQNSPRCENPICPARGTSTVHQDIINSRDHEAPVHLYRCDRCGRVVAQCATARENTWVREYGPLWSRRLTALWIDQHESLRGIAGILGEDPITIKRQAVKVGLVFPRKAVPTHDDAWS